MADTLPTIWNAEPHTIAKHGILRSYLEAWAAILAQSCYTKSQELLFVDGFAGPGEYTGGEPGSPIVALQAVADHARVLPKPVRIVAIESNKERWQNLTVRLKEAERTIAHPENVIVP